MSRHEQYLIYVFPRAKQVFRYKIVGLVVTERGLQAQPSSLLPAQD